MCDLGRNACVFCVNVLYTSARNFLSACIRRCSDDVIQWKCAHTECSYKNTQTHTIAGDSHPNISFFTVIVWFVGWQKRITAWRRELPLNTDWEALWFILLYEMFHREDINHIKNSATSETTIWTYLYCTLTSMTSDRQRGRTRFVNSCCQHYLLNPKQHFSVHAAFEDSDC